MTHKHQAYHHALQSLIQKKHHLNVVVVGANDGKINDPIYDFVKTHAEKTSVLLVEPLQPIIEFLRENYAFHPSHQIANCAVGEAGELTLYSVKAAYWSQFSPAYAREWPEYRAATGVTSAIRSHLESCLKRQNIDPEQAIESTTTPSMPLLPLLAKHDWPHPIDVLQIDAEGFDDVVIFNANIEKTQPTIIFFESHNMTSKGESHVDQYLKKCGYRLYPVKGNTLAVRHSFSLWFMKLSLYLKRHSAK